MLEWIKVQEEIVRRIVRLDERNRSPDLSHDETQFLRGNIAALKQLAQWDPEHVESQREVEPEPAFAIFNEPEA